MDFHSLTRRELQALCKKNGIPANITNVAMADALTALNSTVQGIEEISDSSKSVSVQSSVESPERAQVMSPRVPRTRTTRKKVESSTVVNKTTTTTRRLTRNKKDGVAPINIDVQFSEVVDNQSEISKGKEASIPQTPSMVSDTRKRSSKVEITTTKAYSTRRSTRLAAKTLGHTDTSVENTEKPDAANMKLFSADCGDNFEMNDSEDVQSTDDGNLVSKMMDMSLTSKDGVVTQAEDHDGGILVPKVYDGMVLGDNGGMLAETENHAVSDAIVVDEFVPLPEEEHVLVKVAAAEQVEKIDCDEPSKEYSEEDELLPKSEVKDLVNGDMLAETENHEVSDAIVDEFVPMSEEDDHVLVKVAAVEHVDKIDCDEPSQEDSKEDELLHKSEVKDLVDGDMLAEKENYDVIDAIVDEFVPMSEEDEHVIVKVAAMEQVDKIVCDEQGQEYSKEDELLPMLEVEDLVNGGLFAETENYAVSDAIIVDEEQRVLVKDAAEEQVEIDSDKLSQEYPKEDELLPKSGVEDLVNVAAGEQLVNSKVEEEDIINLAVGKQLVNGGKPSQENSKDDEFLPKSFSMDESSEEEGSEEDESEEGSEDESEEESEEESEDESEEESEDESEGLVFNVAVGGQLVNRDSDKPSELISKEDLPKSFSMEEEYKEEEVEEDLVKVAAGAQLDKKPSENSEKDASSKTSVFVDDSEGILTLPAITAPPTPGKKNPNAAVFGKENLENLSMRQIRKMIKGLNINDDSKNDKKDNLVKKSDEELVETASKRTALQMLPKNQH